MAGVGGLCGVRVGCAVRLRPAGDRVRRRVAVRPSAWRMGGRAPPARRRGRRGRHRPPVGAATSAPCRVGRCVDRGRAGPREQCLRAPEPDRAGHDRYRPRPPRRRRLGKFHRARVFRGGRRPAGRHRAVVAPPYGRHLPSLRPGTFPVGGDGPGVSGGACRVASRALDRLRRLRGVRSLLRRPRRSRGRLRPGRLAVPVERLSDLVSLVSPRRPHRTRRLSAAGPGTTVGNDVPPLDTVGGGQASAPVPAADAGVGGGPDARRVRNGRRDLHHPGRRRNCRPP